MQNSREMAQMPKNGVDGLPKNFISAMRTLFDIMDDHHTGYVNYADIETRWRDDESSGLPKGVLECIKKVTPPNGLLTFDRFCAGLKLALSHTQAMNDAKQLDPNQPNRPPSAPVLESQAKNVWISPNTAAIRPNNIISQQRTLSMPQLPGRKEVNHQPFDVDVRISTEPKQIKVYGPPKPPRTGAALDNRILTGDRNFDKSEIRTALQNWQIGVMMGTDKNSDKRQIPGTKWSPNTNNMMYPIRDMGDGRAVDAQSSHQLAMQMQKKTTNRRREPRRHTLQNGIDYNMIKKLKQIEEEKEVLLMGYNAVEKAREWYLKQISFVQEKMKQVEIMGSHEPWSGTQMEKLMLQRARVVEANRHLATLIATWDKGGLPHMNLEFMSYPATNHQYQQDMLSRLKQKNHRLTEEVNKKSHRIALLEQEKDSLMRELYDRHQSGVIQSRRSTMIHEQHDQTFM
ncbi:suppressor APC domain-containing protein 2 isoform X2 [Trichogramma pretiosum]|uniref:suppressor APC domain-containing protein 2 isoform X2 n=1 Tax=Trichogramma pretiosum TaxID=7493 RepID=UPI0006C970B4|nr:suppressor APC domain-containing protein 2 isoform X2 [Trichogramma pretiosum]